MMHLIFNIRCPIACLCTHHPSSPESLHLPLMGFTPLGDGNTDSSLQALSIVDFTPTQNPYSTIRISSSQSPKIIASLMGFFLLRSNR